jgi:glutaredoxin
VPQIIINGSAIGGCDELHMLERQQKLDPLLAAS